MNSHDTVLAGDGDGFLTLDADCHAAGSGESRPVSASL